MRSKFKKKINFSPGLAIIFLASLFLILVWFRKGLLLGTGESALPFYNIEHAFKWTSFAWKQNILGVSRMITSVEFLFYAFATSLVKLGIPNFATQAIVFFLLLVLGGSSFYFLSGLFFRPEKNRELCRLLSALVYLFNPFTLVVVWNRFQYPFMFFYALMPLALFLFIKGIERKSLIYSLYFNLACFCLVISFAAFALLELFWLVIFSYLLFYLLVNWQNKKKILFAGKFFLTTFSLWVLLNLWWILQYLGLLLTTKFVTTQQVTQLGSIITLRLVSERLGRLLYLFRFHHKNFFENMKEVWGPIYFSPLFLILGFLTPIFTFASLLVKRKPKLYWYFLLLSILGLFFAKGSASPLGQIFLFAFSHFRPLEALRNPFEKIGLILPLGFAPLFALGVVSFTNWIKKFNQKLAIGLLFTVYCLLFLVYMFPMWNGWVYTGIHPPANDLKIGDYVKVPDYYQEANKWLTQDRADFRVIALPLDGEGITYDWEYGYSGVELSNILFNKPYISLNTTIEYLPQIVSPLEDFFLDNPERFYKLMGVLNSKYLMVRSDIDYEVSGTRNPAVIRESLEREGGESNLELVKRFGELEFYQVADKLFLPHFYVAGSSSFIEEKVSDPQNPFVPISFAEFKLRETVVSPQDRKTLPLDVADNVYLSARSHPQPLEDEEEIQLDPIQFLPGSKLYSLVRWLERRLEKKVVATGNLEKIVDLNLKLAERRLIEIGKLAEKRREKLAKRLGKKEIRDEELGLMKETWEKFSERFNRALALLNETENQGGDVTETAYRILEHARLFQERFLGFSKEESLHLEIPDKLKSLLTIERMLEGKAWVTPNELEKRYFIEAPRGGEYDLFVKSRDGEYGYVGGMFEEDPFYPTSFALDGEMATVSGKERDDNWLSFGKYKLKEGQHKLQVFLPRFVNLAKQENFTLFAKKGDYLILALDEFLEEGRNFNISFDYRVEGENLPRLIVAQKVKTNKKDYVTRVADVILPKAAYDLSLRQNIRIDSRAEQAGIKLFFEEYGDAKLYVKNLQVTRDWRPEVVLRTITENEKERQTMPKITFNKINPTKYEVWVEGAEDPYFLVFSESFHLGWKAYLDSVEAGAERAEALGSYFEGEIKEGEPRNDVVYKGMFATWGKRSIPEERHLLVNGYANSWYILPKDVDGKENYKLIIEFWPQRLFYIGTLISGAVLIGCLGYLAVSGIRKFSH